MPLIQCPECSRQVSDKAQACPGCGHPIQTPPAPAETRGPFGSAPIQTIEATSKPFKLATVAGGIGIVLGFVFMANRSEGLAFIFLAGGLLAVVYGRVGAWWHNR